MLLKYYNTVSFICLLIYLHDATTHNIRSLKNNDEENQLCENVDEEHQKMCTNIKQFIDDQVFELKDDIIQKLVQIATLEYDIKKATDFTIPESIERMNGRLAAMENGTRNKIPAVTDIHNPAVDQTLKNNRDIEINELAADIKLLITNTKRMTDQTDSTGRTVLEAIKTVTDRLASLENASHVEQRAILQLNNITEITQTSVSKINQELEVLKKIPTESGSDSNIRSATNVLCDVAAQSSVQLGDNVWKSGETPAEDDLDSFMVNKTGCSYKAIHRYKELFPTPVTFDGTLFEWRGAVRARHHAVLELRWDKGDSWIGYSIDIGDENNTRTRMFEHYTSTAVEQHTPGILSDERYVPLRVSLRPGSLTASTECDRGLRLSLNVSIARGQLVTMRIVSRSLHGAKFLYNCPARAAGL